MSDQVRVTIIEPDGNEYSLWMPNDKTVWEVMELMGWDTGGSCGGLGTCGKCKFRMSGEISPLSASEREHLIPEEIKNGHRLACLATIKGDFTLYIDYWQTQDKSKSNLLRYHPSGEQYKVKVKEFFIPGWQNDSPTPIYDRIKNALSAYRLELTVDNINYLAGLDRPGRPALELNAVIIDGDKVNYVGRQRQTLYGLALDIGSTSLFAALLDLETGHMVAVASQSNMQRIYGQDIISRIKYALDNEDGELAMQRILINNLNSMIDEMRGEKKIDPVNICTVTAVGNPVMLHFLLGLNIAGLATAPFTGVFSHEIQIPANRIGLNVNPLCTLKILPQLGGFVGADTTACLLTLTGKEDTTYLLIDIGTNGEIVLNHRGKKWATSAAAGPAFEGGAVGCGMRAGQGAIHKVSFLDEKLHFRIFGSGLPRGICGSGIIDLISVLLKNDFLDENGTFTEKAAAQFEMRNGEQGAEIILLAEAETLSASPILLTQEDVRQVQLACAAVRTGIEILMKKADIGARQVDKIYLAGAFGSYMDPASLLNIGLVPEVKASKIQNIGNAAAEGAILALLSDDRFAEASIIKSRVQVVALAEQEDFQTSFLKNIAFPSMES